MAPAMPENFTAAERNLIRTEFMVRWGRAPSLEEGIFLHRWAGGPHKGKPKLKPAVQSMLARGLVEIVDPQGGLPFAQFTAAGLEALRAMASNRTFLPPNKYQHLIEELQASKPPRKPTKPKTR
jgi:hypothetical protein